MQHHPVDRAMRKRLKPTLLAMALALPFAASAEEISFTAVGAATWTVPAGVTSLNVTAIGAGGGGGFDSQGGPGGKVTQAAWAVQPGDVIAVDVGGGGLEIGRASCRERV